MIALEDILTAHVKVKPYLNQTFLQYSQTFSKMASNKVYLKPENLQKTGSFKLRGALNAVMSLSGVEKKRGVVTCSAGNWGQALAYASALFGIRSVIVMPEGAAQVKINAVRGYGGEVVIYGRNSTELIEKALAIEIAEGLVYVSPFENKAVIAGYGALGIEIVEEKQELEMIFCPVGGGALIAGVAMGAKAAKPEVKVIGVQPQGANSMYLSRKHGKLKEIENVETIADGLAVKRAGELPFQITQQYVDDIYLVPDDEIKRAIILLLERAKLLVEPAGAAPLAAVLSGQVGASEKETAVILSGGNMDFALLMKIFTEFA